MFELVFSPEVAEALKHKVPIVALESTIISHGMPFPENLAVAKEVEQTIRDGGAVPATIAIIAGSIHIGLSAAELENYAMQKDIVKCSRRDLPFAVAKKLNGSTTVAATMILADLADIRVFATGGIGGVHRNAELTFDVSADLFELAQTNVAVVSAGAKAILDLPKTLEYLETLGVPVIGYQTDDFPAFYSVSSGLKVPIRLDSPEQIATFLKTKENLGMKGGSLIVVPIPSEFSIPIEEVEKPILLAISEAAKQNVSGKELTPFLLKSINTMTSGNSQRANRELILNNARLASKIALALMNL